MASHISQGLMLKLPTVPGHTTSTQEGMKNPKRKVSFFK